MQRRTRRTILTCTTVALTAAVVCAWLWFRPNELRSLVNQRLGLPVAQNSQPGNLSTYAWDVALPGLALTTNGTARVDAQMYLQERASSLDANGDGQRESYTLQQGRVQEAVDGVTIWQTPSDWWVDDFAIADADRDGAPDLVLSVWKVGSFGTSKPFWVSENDQAVRNHMFVYALRTGQPKATWQSSSLSKPNCAFRFGDVDGDGKDELVVLEGQYAADWSCQADHLAVWRWNDWGFVLDWRSSEGRFSTMYLGNGRVFVAEQ